MHDLQGLARPAHPAGPGGVWTSRINMSADTAEAQQETAALYVQSVPAERADPLQTSSVSAHLIFCHQHNKLSRLSSIRGRSVHSQPFVLASIGDTLQILTSARHLLCPFKTDETILNRSFHPDVAFKEPMVQ